MKPQLWHIPFSPWSLKARCALRLRGVAVDEHVYTPLLAEPLLRAKLRSWSGRLTVPVLLTEHGALRDSWDIARYAERVGRGASLFPAERLAEVQAWNERSEVLLSAGRVCAMLRVARAPQAAMEALPAPVGKVLGAVGARLSVDVFNRKYGIRLEDEQTARATARAELSSLRRALEDGRGYLLGELSYADIAMGLALQLVKPLADSAMGPLSRRSATDDALAAEFADLLAYRDRLHQAHGLLPH